VPAAALYARVSSKQQAEANTIASQKEALQVRLQADGLRLEVELCFIDEGYSGGTLLRPALERSQGAAPCSCQPRFQSVRDSLTLLRHLTTKII
jgi:Resolvase, N terminal domain